MAQTLKPSPPGEVMRGLLRFKSLLPDAPPRQLTRISALQGLVVKAGQESVWQADLRQTQFIC